LKGGMRPTSALRTAAGYADRPAEFDELMALLDNELRMVTPVDPSAAQAGAKPDQPDAPASETTDPDPRWRAGLVSGEPTGTSTSVEPMMSSLEPPAPPCADETYYQLTHDYLVPPVRQWLTRKQRETRRGRAELRLAT